MASNRQTSFDRSLETRHVTAISFGLVVCVSTWGSTLIGFGQYGLGFIISIVLAGLLYLVIAMTYSELATMYPRAASIRTYVETEFGNRWGTIASMVYVLSFAAGVSAEVIFFGYVLNGFIDSIPWWGWALLITTFGLVVNLIGVGEVGRIGNYLLWFIVVVTLAVGVLALSGVTVEPPDFSKLSAEFTSDGIFGLVSAFLLAMWLFAGFEVVCPLAEEIKEPGRSLPRGMFIAIFLIGALNIIFGLGAYVLVEGNVLASSDALVVIGSNLGGSVGVALMFLFAVACTGATVMSNYSSVSRLMYGMAEKPQNMLPAQLNWLHPRFKTPWRTLFVYYAFTLILILSFGFIGMAALIYIASFIWIVQYMIALVVLILLRKRRPEQDRPYRVPGGKIPILSIFGFVAILVFIVLSVMPPFGDLKVLYYGGALIIAIVAYGLIMGIVTERRDGYSLRKG